MCLGGSRSPQCTWTGGSRSPGCPEDRCIREGRRWRTGRRDGKEQEGGGATARVMEGWGGDGGGVVEERAGGEGGWGWKGVGE